ncbi:type I restriction-modification system methyltransferase subunit [Bernardetia litoralis DSM 6794]|uniref:site-specific DNA-methyltransferase (adenine-specific) n=1 Tax=Bernardetia litoralis (strain ATCC 23117 / DSM 6794 / NBRC 15988 / NCIMB 1366 / Fx l1 / Sio-4) TaxID=880071 RepID=I4ANY8_BERLS|nr:TaqI-like C-terminal specificity domain-containing protein [Bernardetia litoralis]AFM05673.1 type I restriction-modification system methyltransferase subunit [Bernardetia litoralis DSM 6794]
MGLFQYSVLKNHLKFLPKDKLEIAWQKFVAHFHNPIIQENIRASKEEQYQEGFLNDLFVEVFGYVKNPNISFNLTTELKNIKNAKKTDGALLRRGNAFAVIELKGMDTTDLSKVETQAFGYKNNQPNCSYVIISNFEKLRFYIDNAVDFEEFNLFTLTREHFEILYFCLSFETLLRDDKPKQAKEESLNKEENITKTLYKDYSEFRNDVFQNIQTLNPKYDKLTLFKKTQKLLDRFLFIFFAEDKLLLPPNLNETIIEEWRDLAEIHDIKMPLYEKYKLYFNYLYKGKKNIKHDIFPYNGGLFQTDKLLDTLKIDDALLARHTQKISTYDFDSEVSVNILGHIFEHSMNEFEEIHAEIEGKELEKQTTRRKKDGVFYTPKYITKYIVDNAVGKLCQSQKQELGLSEESLEKNYEIENGKPISNKKISQAIKDKIENYRNWLLEITICDPACGSGAFLNQALEFLITEHHYLYELELKLIGTAQIDIELENKILAKNIFGVDINEESVEIAKLSLWLRTAQRGRKLTTLNDNIKCGNSLIDDKEIAGEKAFNWQKEFPTIFKGKNKGFDVVIGNPPYGIFVDKKLKKHYNENFPLTSYKINLYILFVERMIQILERGIVFFILPKSLLFNSFYDKIRYELLKNTQVNEISTITEKVFEDAEVGGSLLLSFTIKKDINPKNKIKLVASNNILDFVTQTNVFKNEVEASFFLNRSKYEISVHSSGAYELIKKLAKMSKIKDYYELKNGLNTGNIKHILISNEKLSDAYKKIIWGKDISKYSIDWSGSFVNYDENIDETISLEDTKSKSGMNKQNRIDYALRSAELFESKKIVVRKTGDSLIASLDNSEFYFDTLVHGIYAKNELFPLKYVLAILNSSLATKIYRIKHDVKGKVFAKISLGNLSSLPIPKPTEIQTQKIITLVDKMLSLNANFSTKKGRFLSSLSNNFDLKKLPKKLENFYELDFKGFLKELEKKKITLSLFKQEEWQDYFEANKKEVLALYNQIQATDNEIDKLVFELYGLTEDEIEIVKQN